MDTDKQLAVNNPPIDPIYASFEYLLVVVFLKSTSKNFPLALNLAQQTGQLIETKIDGKQTYCVCFGNDRVNASRAIAFLDLASDWKGTQIFSRGRLVSNRFKVIDVLNCYIKAQSCRNPDAHCHVIIDDPYNQEIERSSGLSLAITIRETPPITHEIDVDRYSFPCKHLRGRFHIQTEHPASVPEQIEAAAVDNGCEWCPNFNADNWEKVGTKKVIKEYFE